MSANIPLIYNTTKLALQKYNAKHNSKKALKTACVLDRLLTYYYSDNSNMLYDADIESLIDFLSSNLSCKYKSYVPRDNYYVFCDSLAWDIHGLSIQYLRALMSMQAQLLYIITAEKGSDNCPAIINELKEYGKAEIYVLRTKSISVERIEEIIKVISNFRPLAILLHSFSIMDAIAVMSLQSSIRYRINLGDHVFWSGIHATDYIIEFREYGCYQSINKRSIDPKKLLLLPYYPANDNNVFMGFPKLAQDSVILFSGGATYKMLDNSNTFLSLIKSLIEDNPSLIVLLVTRDNNSKITDFIVNNHIEDRVIQIEYRKDITEVMRHSDLYLQTYPIGGGLMTQYAAQNGIPILSLLKPSVLNNIPNDDFDSFFAPYSYRCYYSSKEELLNEAKRIINDKIYRSIIGEKLKTSIISPEDFNKSFRKLLLTHTTERIYSGKVFNSQSFHRTIGSDLDKTLRIICFIILKLKMSLLFTMPSLVVPIISSIMSNKRFFYNKLKKKLTHP